MRGEGEVVARRVPAEVGGELFVVSHFGVSPMANGRCFFLATCDDALRCDMQL